MRLLLLLAITLAGCPSPEPSTFCADLAEQQPSCMDDDALAECEAAEERCPGRVAVLESCPLQFECSGPF